MDAHTVILADSIGSVRLCYVHEARISGEATWDLSSGPVLALGLFKSISGFGYRAPQPAQRAVAACEAGSVYLLDLDRRSVIGSPSTGAFQSSSAVLSLCCVGDTTVLMGSLGGHLTEWDVRAQATSPAHTDHFAPALISVCAHPTNEFVCASGSASGVLSLWDRRRAQTPIFAAEASPASLWSITFMPRRPSLLLTGDDTGK